MPSITSRLGVELPVIQAPMAGVQASALAIAVSAAFGLDALGVRVVGDVPSYRVALRGVDFVFHAAACKQVPMLEAQVRAALAITG